MHFIKTIKNIYPFLFLSILSGCGSQESETSTLISNTTISTEIRTGYFIDAPVEGLRYFTPTLNGITDANGMFKYKDGENVSFYVDNINIGTIHNIPSDKIVTPADIVGVSRSDTSNESVIKIAKFLQSCDDDGDVSKTIKISTMTTSPSSLATLNAAQISEVLTYNSKSIVSDETAKNNLSNGMQNFIAVTVNPATTSSTQSSSTEEVTSQTDDTPSDDTTPYNSETEVKKYSFEDDAEGWTYLYSGACTVTHSAEKYDDDGSIYVTDRSNTYDGASVDITNHITANKLYLIRGFIKSESNDTYMLNAKIGSATPVYKQLSQIKVDDENWNRFKTFVTFTQDEIDSGITIYVNSENSKHNYYLDDIEIVKTAYDPTKESSSEILKVSGNKIVDKESNTQFIKGVNVIAYSDIQSTSAEEFMNYTYFNIDKHDIANIKELGFNAIRIALWYKYFEDDTNINVYKNSGFEWLDTIIGWAKEYGIYVMLDMHAPQGGGNQGPNNTTDFWGDETYKSRFINLWKQIASRYKNESTIYAYDLINEPCPAQESDYRTLLENTISAIREIDTNHIINVEISFADDGKEPFKLESDNLIYDFHFYDPWDDFTDNSDKVYETDVSKSDVITRFEHFSDFYNSNNIPFNITEFGQKYSTFDAKNSVNWVKDVIEVTKEKGNGYFYFSYKGNEFSIYEENNKYSENSAKNETLTNYLKSQ